MIQEKRSSALALLPLFVFFGIYLIVSIVVGDFYKMPITVAFVASSLSGVPPLEIIGSLYYPMLIGAMGVLSIVFRFPRKYLSL